jgi:CubicO group peptidase (beta-lactamase class C family)
VSASHLYQAGVGLRVLLLVGVCSASMPLSGYAAKREPDATRLIPQERFPTAPPETQDISTTALAELTREVQGYVERGLIVGGELLVVKNRRTVLHETFGYADRDDDVPWTKGTVSNIRSMTKPITGAAAQILIDRGQLGLEDPVARYLPGFDTEAAREITVRQMLTHRAGLPVNILTAMDEYATLVDFGNAVGARGPRFEPDSQFWYTDSGTDALGAIVEVVSGKRLDEFVREELLEPLGMSESFYFLDDEDPRREKIASLYAGTVDNWRRFLNPDEGAFYPFAWGSQSLYSTPLDYAKFLAMWLDGGRVGTRALLSEAAVARSLHPVSEMTMVLSETRHPTAFAGLEVYYGQMAMLHVPIGSKDGPPTIIGHSGADGTYASAWPARDLMVLFFTQKRGGSFTLRLEEAIDRLLIAPEAYADRSLIPVELEPYVGTYIADWADHMKEEFVVHVRGGRLSIDIPSLADIELVPAADEGTWSFAIAPTVSLWFERDDEGRVNCLRIRQGQLTYEAPRKGTPHEQQIRDANRADPELLQKYLGAYEDPESGGVARVFIDGDYLAIESEVGVFHLWKHPIEDAWVVRENTAFSITFQEEDGVVVSFTRNALSGARTVFPRGDRPRHGTQVRDTTAPMTRLIRTIAALARTCPL